VAGAARSPGWNACSALPARRDCERAGHLVSARVRYGPEKQTLVLIWHAGRLIEQVDSELQSLEFTDEALGRC